MNYVFKLLEKHIREMKERIEFWEGVGDQKKVSEARDILFSLVASLELLKNTNEYAIKATRSILEGSPDADDPPKGLAAFQGELKA